MFTWDIAKLHSSRQRTYFDVYVTVDIYSRNIVGVQAHVRDSGESATEINDEVFEADRVPKALHAVRRTPMMSKSLATLLEDFDVHKSPSRPKGWNDNPSSEVGFKTVKYLPSFRERFGSLAHARDFLWRFFSACNIHHQHSGIRSRTPADVHFGTPDHDDHRLATLAKARLQHPERFDSSRLAKTSQLPKRGWTDEPVELNKKKRITLKRRQRSFFSSRLPSKVSVVGPQS